MLEEIADLAMNDLAMNSGSVEMEQFRVEMLMRRGMFPISGLLLKLSSLGEVNSGQRAEIQWKDRLAN